MAGNGSVEVYFVAVYSVGLGILRQLKHFVIEVVELPIFLLRPIASLHPLPSFPYCFSLD